MPRASSCAHDLAERLRAGGVEHLEVGQAQDDDLHSVHRGELGQEALRGAEEEGAVEAVGEDVLLEQLVLLVGGRPRRRPARATRSAVAVAFRATARSASSAATATPISTATMRSKATVAAAVSTSTAASARVERSTMRTPWTSTIRHAVTISTPASAASGISATSAPPRYTTPSEHDRVGDRRQAGASTGAHVHRGAGDRAGRRHAPEQRRDQVGEALTEQLAVGIVRCGVAHAVGDLRREQALEPGEQRDRERGREELARAAPADTLGSDGAGSAARERRRCA